VPVEPPKTVVEHPTPIQEIPQLPPVNVIEKRMRCYQMTRFSVRSIKGRRLRFQLRDETGAIYLDSKLKSATPSVIHVSRDKAMHFRDKDYYGAIVASSSMSSYSIRERTQYGPELAVIKFAQKRGIGLFRKQRYPRVMRVLFSEGSDVPRFLMSKMPGRSPIGQWYLDFGPRPIVSSVKNAILIDSQGQEMCFVMKAQDGSLNVETVERMSPLVVFAIGVASYLCKLT
jgi:hypothetical protein